MQESSRISLIPDLGDRERQRRRKVDRFTLEDFQYNERADEYVCPNGKRLKLRAKSVIVDGVIYRRYAADREFCRS